MPSFVLSLIGLLKLLVNFYCYALVLRLWMQKFKANAFNPVSQSVRRITDPVVKPVRFLVPGYKGFDGAIVVLVCAIQFLFYLLMSAVIGTELAWYPCLLVGVVQFFILNVNIFMFVVFIGALLSWFPQARHHAVAGMIDFMSLPLIGWVRGKLPSRSGIDFSPMVTLIGLYVVKLLVLMPPMYYLLQAIALQANS